MVSGAITGFIQDLRNGVDAGEAFNNMLNRIIDSLINMAVQMAVQSLFNPAGGGGIGGSAASCSASRIPAALSARRHSRSAWSIRGCSSARARMASGGLVGPARCRSSRTAARW